MAGAVGPSRAPVRQSLLRPMLILGGERELVFMSGMLAGILVFSLGQFSTAVLGVLFWGFALFVLQRMAKHDPQLSKVYIRHVNRKIYYPASPHWTAPERELKKNQ
jgi:type IV secretory pathway TrbD component